MPNPIKLMIADDHPALISGLKQCLESNLINVISTTTDVSSVLSLYKELKPDVLILDVSFGRLPEDYVKGVSGLDLIVEIINEDKSAKIVIYTQYDEIQLIEKFYRLGAKGFLSKSANTTELQNCIMTVASGEIFIANGIAEKLAYRSVNKAPGYELSDVDKSIIKLKSLGKTEQDIAIELNLSKSTITKKIRDLKEKFSIGSTSELIEMAYNEHLLEQHSW